MNEEAKQILTDPELVMRRRMWEQRLKDLFDGRIPDAPIYLWGAVWTGKTSMYENPEKRVKEASSFTACCLTSITLAGLASIQIS